MFRLGRPVLVGTTRYFYGIHFGAIPWFDSFTGFFENLHRLHVYLSFRDLSSSFVALLSMPSDYKDEIQNLKRK